MPPSSLDRLMRYNVEFPMMFKLSEGHRYSKCMHCGVLEFIAEEGKVFVPQWMMDNLGIAPGDEITLQNVTLPIGSYVKFQPENDSFLNVADQKVVLETVLRDFSCLTKGDKVAVYYNGTQYNLFVKELKPANAVNIVECDLYLDNEAPEGYKEQISKGKKDTDSTETASVNQEVQNNLEAYMKGQMSKKFTAFSGMGNRSYGKKVDKEKTEEFPITTGISDH